MNRNFRLKKSTDFKKVKDTGRVYFHPFVKMAAARNGLQHSRFAFVTSKMIGNAVVRNRCRRRLRAIVNARREACESGWDLVFIARKQIKHSSSSDLQAAIDELLHKANLV